VIISLQVMGQAYLRFELSVAQILISIGTCALLEVAIAFYRRRVILWPASALLTGNGVAFILRVPGTVHGDWWSLHGWWLFVLVAAVSLLSKYVIRVGGRHLFNPSNFGLVIAFVLLGSGRASPQDLWWGPMSSALIVTLSIIAVGGLLIVTRLRMLGLTLGFWITFAASMGLLAASGHSMAARWHLGAVSGWLFWTTLVTSPEILVFLFFMITDPKTAPAGRVARVVFGVGVAVVAAFLVAPEQTEFSTKVAILAGLAVMCAIRPVLDRVVPSTVNARALVAPRAVLAAAVTAGALLVVGNRARGTPPTLITVGHVAAGARPPVSIPPSAIPPVTIDSGVHSIDSSVTRAKADALADDLLADLAIEATALQRRDPALAATAAAGAELQRLRGAVAGGAASVPTYRFDHITVLVVRTQRWAAPELGARVTGTVHRVDVRGATAGRSSDASFSATFVLVLTGGHFLIVAVDLA
jgi:Na+-translocating ferredoxin:NAD+ oxidoreductase RnfD subunit